MSDDFDNSEHDVSTPGLRPTARIVRALTRVKGAEAVLLRLKDRFGTPELATYFVCGAATWKHEFLTGLLTEIGASSVVFVHRSINSAELDRLLLGKRDPVFVCWGMRETGDFSAYAERKKFPFWRIEDGFIRSIGLGAKHIPPASLMVDKSGGIHFRSDRPSELEEFLENHDFHDDEIRAARSRIDEIVSLGLTKYNLQEFDGVKGLSAHNENVLVFGQVEDDASIKFGSPLINTNADLLDAVLDEHPKANVFFRPHPDVAAGLRREKSSLKRFRTKVEFLEGPIAIWDHIGSFDKVCVMTSLAGFESLMRGVDVRTYGMPFYAGWGITDDFLPSRRRTKTLSLEQVFFGAYMHASTYIDPLTGRRCGMEDVIAMLHSASEKVFSEADMGHEAATREE